MKNINFHRQQAAVLVSILLITLVMTLLAISNTQQVVQNERIVFNYRDQQTAFVAANAALLEGENRLATMLAVPEPCDEAPCEIFSQASLPDVEEQNASWWSTHARTYSGEMTHANSAPLYIIEQYYFIPDDLSIETVSAGIGTYYYQVSARGTGRSDDSEVIVQSIYSTRYQ